MRYPALDSPQPLPAFTRSFTAPTQDQGHAPWRAPRSRRMRFALILALFAATPDPGPALVRSAREVLGVPYRLGGRMRGPDDGLDCQGLVFYSVERLGPCAWRSFSVFPTESIQGGELGRVILQPTLSAQLDLQVLRPGDVLWLVGYSENPKEPAIGLLGDRPVWVWHLALYAGGGRMIAGDHHAGEVAELELRAYLQQHADEYAGILVTRLDGPPVLRRCRSGRLSTPRERSVD